MYHNMGGGGVDFPAVFKLLRDRRFKGWAIFDMDGPRKGDDNIAAADFSKGKAVAKQARDAQKSGEQLPFDAGKAVNQ